MCFELITGSSNSTASPKTDSGWLCGRTVNRFDCISSKTLYTIVLVIGLAFLLMGSLALAGHCAPLSNTGVSSPLFSRFHAAFHYIADQMGTNPLLIISFTSAFGLAFTLAGSVGLCLDNKNPIPPSNQNENPSIIVDSN